MSGAATGAPIVYAGQANDPFKAQDTSRYDAWAKAVQQKQDETDAKYAALSSNKKASPTATERQSVVSSEKAKSAAVQKSGGTKSTSLLNQGMTPAAVIKTSASGGAPSKIFRIMLADNYASLIKPLNPPMLKQADWYRSGQPSDNPDVEGPYKLLPRMIDEFENEQVDTASIRVVNSKNEDLVPPYSKFILESVTEGHTERSQIVETFGDFYVFLYGERPPVYTYSGTLINSRNANWVSDFSYYYENYLRGTKCVENNASLVLTYAGAQVIGFMLNASYAKNATTQAGVRFNFQVVITSKKYLGMSNDAASYVSGGVTKTDAKIKEILNSIAGTSGQGTSDTATSVASGLAFGGVNGAPMAGVIPGG